MLRPDPAQLPRLLEIRDNLITRIAEAEREGWLGEIEGLQVSLAGTKEEIAQAQASATPRTVQLGIPTLGSRPASPARPPSVSSTPSPASTTATPAY